MKKYVITLLAIVLTCLAVCSCTYRENVWFDDEILEKCLVPELPKVQNDYFSRDGEDVYVKFTTTERENYAEEVYEYLKSCNFKYLGTRGEEVIRLFSNSDVKYYLEPADELPDFYVNGVYKFVFSDGTLDKNEEPIFSVITIAAGAQGTKTLKNGFASFEYNTVISVRCDNDSDYEEKYTHHEYSHTFHTLDINDTCVYCGYKLTYPDGIAQIIIDKDNNIKRWRDDALETHPGYIAYYNPVCGVQVRFYVFGSAEPFIEACGLEELCSNGSMRIGEGDFGRTPITIAFDRDDFTEEIYQKLLQIENKNTAVDDMYIFELRGYYQIYFPNINDYSDRATEIDYTVMKQSAYRESGDEETLIFRSKYEYEKYLKNLLKESKYTDEEIENLANLYDDSFFEKNALIVTPAIYEPSGSIIPVVDGVYIANGEAYVVIKTSEPVVQTCDIKYWTFAVAVRKTDLDGIEKATTLE